MKIELPYEFEPRSYQLPAWEYMQNGGKRAVLVWHRRAGKDLFVMNRICCAAHERVGIYWHIFPTYKQGKKIAWNGSTNDGRKFLDYFPKELIESVNNTEMTVKFKNGSIYQIIGADQPDSLVGSNPIGCAFSEYSLMTPVTYDLIRPILSANDGWAIFIFTPRGHNFAYDLLCEAERNDFWYAERLGIDTTGAVPLSLVEDDRRMGLSEPLIQQEYYVSFEAPIDGAYYADQMIYLSDQNRITDVPFDPMLDVHTSWDLGVDDSTSIWFYQLFRQQVRLIDYYENSGEGLPFYAQKLDQWADKKKYRYGEHYMPWDINVKELGTGQTRLQTIRELGIKPKIVPKVKDVHDRINAVRTILPLCYIDHDNCRRGIQCLRSYRAKIDPDTKMKSTAPLHDFACHGADAMGGVAYHARRFKRRQGREFPKQALDNWH